MIDKYVRAHVVKFSHQSITTTDFKSYLYEYFSDKHEILDTVDWNSWFHKPGMPPVMNSFDQTLTNNCQLLCDSWKQYESNGTAICNLYNGFNSNQKVLFLEKMCSVEPRFEKGTLDKLNETYHFSSNNNAEIKAKWLLLCLQSNHSKYYQDAVDFATKVGRMKFVRPTFRALFQAVGGKDLAVKSFTENRSFYHPICATMVARDLKIE